MPKQLHSVTDLDFQPDAALHPLPADWRDHFVYSLTARLLSLLLRRGLETVRFY